MGIPGKGLTNSMALRTKSMNKKQKARYSVTDITNQDLRKLLKGFTNSPYLGYKNKQLHNEPTEDLFLLIRQVSNIIKIKTHVWICNKGVKLDVDKTNCVNKTIVHVNQNKQSGIT